MSILSVYLIILFKTCLCIDVISLIVFHVLAALNLSKSFSWCNIFASQMLFLSITLYVFRLVQYVLHSTETGCNIFSYLYNLSLHLIDLNRPLVIKLDFLCLHL